MDTVITSLLSSDLFLIETPSYTGTISASQVNYVSTQFPKIYSLIGANAFNVLEATTNVLSVQNIKPFTTKVATVTGNFSWMRVRIQGFSGGTINSVTITY